MARYLPLIAVPLLVCGVLGAWQIRAVEPPSIVEERGGAYAGLPLRIRQTSEELRLDVQRVVLESGPQRITVQGMVHLAEPDFFAGVQARYPRALFEGLIPEPDETAPPAEKKARTLDRIHALSRALRLGRPTAELERVDAWGEPLRVDGIRVVSWGADGRAGGEGDAADLTSDEVGEEPGLDELAAALGLSFQLTALDTAQPGWRNVDLEESELRRLLLEAGADVEAVGDLLDRALQTEMLALLEELEGASDETVARTRIMVMDSLVYGDRLARAGPLGPYQDIIVGARDDAVLEALTAEGSDVALLYGALHVGDLVHKLQARGFVVVERGWDPVMRVDLASQGLGAVHVDRIRQANAAAIARFVAAARGH